MAVKLRHERAIAGVLKQRLAEPHPLLQVVVGPRQVGKTTAIRQALAGRGLYASADSPAPLQPQDIEAWWRAAQKTDEGFLAIDEVQKISGWSETIKKLWDSATGKKLKVVLSGSAALAIERDLRESLAGRFELLRAEHWNFGEAHKAFGMSLREYVERGCYPGSMLLAGDVARWAEYLRDAIVEPVIGRDILQLHPVQNPALLRQLFGAAVGLPAQVVSLHTLQGALQDSGALATLQHYLQLLEHGFLVSGLQKYSQAAIRARRSPPKLVIHDNGLMRAFERPPTAPLTAARMGRYFENTVASRFVESGWETYYWRERNLEVDLVVIGPSGERWAIEVKSSHAKDADFRGLRIFCARHPEFKPCLVSMEDQHLAGLQTLPARDILSMYRGGPLPKG